ncbi:hypothetical protein V1477_003663 [Vespula maculifrons]|uniref:Uncharacterized protein n=1 Tax=Vespula maculifrons TaxID=7453 RepID=A0ABD2CTL0_VESMC
MSPTHGTHPRGTKRSWKNLKICSHSLGNTSIPLNLVTKKVLPTQVPPRGGCCIHYRRTLFAPENTTPMPADKRVSVLPILPVFRADISRFAKKRKR